MLIAKAHAVTEAEMCAINASLMTTFAYHDVGNISPPLDI